MSPESTASTPGKILCVLENHKFVNEVVSVCQSFFHGAKFRLQFGPWDDALLYFEDCEHAVISALRGEQACAAVVARQTAQDAQTRSEHCVQIDNEYIHERRAIMLAVFHALQRARPTPTPWGSLTGIRPAKLVGQWLQGGAAADDIAARLVDVFCLDADKARLAVQVAQLEADMLPIFAAARPSLYISIPFCPGRCAYCSFNPAHKPPTAQLVHDYVDALCAEIVQKTQGQQILSVYIGGGTPSMLPLPLLEKVLRTARQASPDALEFSVEAGRPDTITPENLALMREYGADRISINPQTLNDATLASVGRAHSCAQFFDAFAEARAAGFGCINCDVIAGLPNEGTKDMHATMQGLRSPGPDNITVHALAIKRASDFAQRKPANPAAETCRRMLEIAHTACGQMGMVPYYLYRQKNTVGQLENTGFARAGALCIYNLAMMSEMGTVLGAGAGAVTKFVEGKKIRRVFNPKLPEVYLRGAQ